ncbi:glycosyltransferase family 32 protein [Limosilactobacillus urinaemulieris]|uniref:glycosyltransferase family 32 protein n=1 Tax=Limosilactobacillus urinaemulieris TaxID=2742600 RepID=UPI001F56DE69|nr:glycosyltransferase [Limosilactobacillus urinaemulieris]
MIPKIIHYAWFGSEKPEQIKNRVNEWKSVLPEWKFICWNENNYDIHKFKFSGDKYDKGQYGYIVDELRYDVLYNYGGFYLDTDEVIKKDLTPLLNNRMVWGFMYDNSISGGLIGSEPQEEFLMYLLDTYAGKINTDIYNKLGNFTSNPIITSIFLRKWSSLKLNGEKQELENGIIIFPKDYFCYLSRNNKANYAQHLFDNSWGVKNKGMYGFMKRKVSSLFPYAFSKISAKRGAKIAEQDMKLIRE